MDYNMYPHRSIASNPWLKCYNHPYIAALFDNMYENHRPHRIWEVVTGGVMEQGVLSVGYNGCTEATVVKEVFVPMTDDLVKSIARTVANAVCAPHVLKNAERCAKRINEGSTKFGYELAVVAIINALEIKPKINFWSLLPTDI